VDLMAVAIIDYGSGNLHSAAKAFERAARDSGHAMEIVVTAEPETVRVASPIVLPGVGAFKDCREGLKAVPGMWETLDDEVTKRGKPFLGICVGMQLMAARGLEHDVSEGFGWIEGDVVRIEPADAGLKIPHMGWNTLDLARPHPLLEGLSLGENGLHAYFVHSYHLAAANSSDVVATAPYGMAITALVARDNMAGTQFHPEKSQALGLGLIANFLRWRP
jgi:glutamine amidotransferase